MTEAQAEECLAHLKKLRESGNDSVPIEDVVVERGYLSGEQSSAIAVAYSRFQKEAEKRQWSITGYDILTKIGEGGLGVVYKAKQVSMNRIVALKILHRRWQSDEEFKKRFLIEARLVGKLSHHNLIKVFDVGREDWKYYYSMEFVDGESVETVLDRDGAMEVGRSVDIIIQVTRALKYLSGYDVVHCDIKPGNILLTTSGQAKLGDFGFVKSNIDIKVSDEGSVLGTPDYISPEQALGKSVDFRSDIYSLGATFYHMVTGRTPFAGSVSTKMKLHIKGDVEAPRRIDPSLSPLVSETIVKMMARDPANRFQTFEDLFADLERIRDAEGGKPRGEGATDRGDEMDGREGDVRLYQAMLVVVAALLLVSVVLNAWLVMQGS